MSDRKRALNAAFYAGDRADGFTKELRHMAEVFWKSRLKMARFRKKVRQACDIIDAKDEEIERLKQELENRPDFSKKCEHDVSDFYPEEQR